MAEPVSTYAAVCIHCRDQVGAFPRIGAREEQHLRNHLAACRDAKLNATGLSLPDLLSQFRVQKNDG
jgi:hypothetical protein